MSKITIHTTEGLKVVEGEEGKSLLQILHNNNIKLFAPCGGNGTCGKCRVELKEHGSVTSCVFYPENDIEVIIPDNREAKILTAQYEFTRNLRLQPGETANFALNPYGVAIDIGTTSLVFYLINLITGGTVHTLAAINPQGKYGADVISRISYCGGDKEKINILQREVIQEINKSIKVLINDEAISENEIVKISVTANTTMLHLLLGVDPTSIALAPFTPQFIEAKQLKTKELELISNKEAELNILPSISGYVGADIVAGIASLDPLENVKNYLFIDIGTNGEMALVTPEKIWACATAAGPAFEGANITCGMGAFSGAISEYNKNGYHTISDEKPIGICGSGLIDIIAFLIKKEQISSDGLLEEDFILADEKKSGNGKVVKLSQQDVREVQLAKGAIASGIKIMMEYAQLSFDNVDALFLAGGFGNYIDVDSAMTIGLLPKEMSKKIIPVGNTSGTGACLDIKSVEFIEIAKTIVAKTEYIELSNYDGFEMEFAMSMYF